MSVLSLGLLLPLAVPHADRMVAMVENAADFRPSKHVTLVQGASRSTIETRATTADELLASNGITRRSGDRVTVEPAGDLIDGSTVVYQSSAAVRLAVNGKPLDITTTASTVRELLAERGITLGARDRLTPSPSSPVADGMTVALTRVTSWLTHIHLPIAPPVRTAFDIRLRPGTSRVVVPGQPGAREITVAYLQPNPALPPKRVVLASRILRLPQTKIIAQGVGDGVALSEIARRGFVGTMRLASAALKMVATAYTAACSGCSGLTSSGRHAGHGVVAVDPHIIPLGSKLFIPGYGHAYAGDTGGAITGHRIDLGFDSARDAMSFGRRPIVVYVLK